MVLSYIISYYFATTQNHKVAKQERIEVLVEQLVKKLRNLFLATMSAKKDDPNYVAIRGHIPKELYKKFKVFCLEREVDNSQGLEDLLCEYFEMKDKAESSAPPIKKKGKGAA
jgi:hypothetical protein